MTRPVPTVTRRFCPPETPRWMGVPICEYYSANAEKEFKVTNADIRAAVKTKGLENGVHPLLELRLDEIRLARSHIISQT